MIPLSILVYSVKLKRYTYLDLLGLFKRVGVIFVNVNKQIS